MRNVFIGMAIIMAIFVMALIEAISLGALLFIAIVGALAVALTAAYDTYRSHKQEGGVR